MTVDKTESPAATKPVQRTRRRGLATFALSLLVLPAWAYLWFRGGVSGWWVVLWVLVIGQLGVSVLFVYRWNPESPGRRWLLQQIAFNFVWATAVGVVLAQLSTLWMVLWYLFASVWIGAMSFAYVRGRKRVKAAVR